MRKKPSCNGIYKIKKLPSNCSDCGKLIYGGVCMYEIDSEYISCQQCFENSGGPEEGQYMIIEEYNKDTELRFFQDEASIINYENKYGEE